ncbi:hypothetical protein N8A98_07045 [Devosia neptuniae]|uniref:DUF669 domain-containing protein n=1 Tax=Devosia neptuniae TaxID=191302 RepID=A0ABY6CFC6_9HYPH|nr:hypothetical protein [Devosia neptuniae]UXN70938.1 hypothetical protein N8A98_07045 [Devosia neptuniae]
MAKFGFKYEVDVEATENQGGSFELLPEMFARLEVSACDLEDTQDKKGTQAKLVVDVIEPEEFAGRKLWFYWTIDHADGKVVNKGFGYGKAQFDRLCRAVGEAEPDDTDEILFKPFVAKVGIAKGKPDGKGGMYKDKNQIERWFYTDDDAKEPVPEPGVIEGGAKPAAANDNARPAAAAAPAAKPADSKPWTKKAA